MWKNIWFCVGKLKQYEGVRYILYGVLCVAARILIPFLEVWFPSFVLALLTQELGWAGGIGLTGGLQTADVLRIVGLIVAGGALILCLQSVEKALMQQYSYAVQCTRLQTGTEYCRRILEIPYGELESKEGKEKMERALAANFSSWQDGTEGILRDVVSFLEQAGGLLLYGMIVVSLHPLLLLLLAACPLPGAGLARRKRAWMQEHKRDWTPYEVKRTYLGDVAAAPEKGKDIRLYRLNNWILETFAKNNEGRFDWQRRENEKEFQIKAVNRLTGFLRSVVCYGYLLYQVWRNGMSAADFLLYLGVIRGFSDWVMGVVTGWNRLENNGLLITDYQKFMKERPEEQERRKSLSVPEGETFEIRLENVSFSYPETDREVLSHISLAVRAGEKVALVGMNGAGKTTLVKLLTGLYEPKEGQILLNGVDRRSVTAESWQKAFSVVFQDVCFFAFSLEENITCRPEEETEEKRLWDCLEAAGLAEKVRSLPDTVKTPLTRDLDEKGIELSGGEKQKLMLARALYKKGSVIVLDEPTSALDPLAERELYEKYQKLTQGRTSLFISHRLSSTQFCDRIIFLKDGKIAEEGTHETLMQRGGDYAEMYEKQAYYYQKELEEGAADNE